MQVNTSAQNVADVVKVVSTLSTDLVRFLPQPRAAEFPGGRSVSQMLADPSPVHPAGQHDRWHARRVGCSTDNVRRSDSCGQVQSTTVRAGANRTAPDVRLGQELGISTRRRRHLCCDLGCRLTLGAGAVGYSDQNAVKLGQPGTRLHVRHTHGTQSGTTMSQTIEYTS